MHIRGTGCHSLPPNEYEGGHGPAFTSPTKPRTGNHGTAGGFDHSDHNATAVGSRAVAAGGLGDPTSGWRLRPQRPRHGGGRVSRSVLRQRAALEIRLAVGGFKDSRRTERPLDTLGGLVPPSLDILRPLGLHCLLSGLLIRLLSSLLLLSGLLLLYFSIDISSKCLVVLSRLHKVFLNYSQFLF
jgi:hypothetical protein